MRTSDFSRFFALFCVLNALVSCTQKGESSIADWDCSFGEAKKLVSKSVLKDELILGRPFLIQYVDSSLVIYDDIGDSLFVLVDLKESGRIYRFGQKGEGDNEFLQVFSFCNMKSDSILGVYDTYKHDLREINLDKIKRGEIDFPVLFKDTLSSIKLLPTEYGTFLGLGFYENNMFSLIGDSIGANYFFEYPYKDEREKKISNRLRGMAYQGTLCSNQALNKCLYAVRHAPIFMLYSIKEDRIIEEYEWIGGYPDYATEEAGEYRSAPISAANKISFLAAYATNNYVYLLYSGRSVKDAGLNAFKANVIYQLSWEGNPVRKFELDYPLSNFCLSDDDAILYALVDKGELELVQYSLKGIDE